MVGSGASLRERKKAQTRLLIADVAMGLFAARGFEAVTVAEIARAANVSVNTVFNYFATKEDLFFDRQDVVVDLLGSVVRGRAAGESVIGALRRHHLDGLAAGDWTSGVTDGAADFARMIEASPSLRARERELGERSLAAMARTLAAETDAGADDPMPTIVAGMVTGARHALAVRMREKLLAGEPLPEIRQWFADAAGHAYDLLEEAVPGYGVRSGPS
jgi:AcrR family transcriptional regulator